jgi:hypothetical protein
VSKNALAVEAIALDIVDWDIEEIGEQAGFDIEYRYRGMNDPKDSSLACVTQFVGIYEDSSKLDRPFPQTTKSAIALQSCQIYSILPIISSGTYTS